MLLDSESLRGSRWTWAFGTWETKNLLEPDPLKARLSTRSCPAIWIAGTRCAPFALILKAGIDRRWSPETKPSHQACRGLGPQRPSSCDVDWVIGRTEKSLAETMLTDLRARAASACRRKCAGCTIKKVQPRSILVNSQWRNPSACTNIPLQPVRGKSANLASDNMASRGPRGEVARARGAGLDLHHVELAVGVDLLHHLGTAREHPRPRPSQDSAKGGAVEAGCSDLHYAMYCFIT